MLHFMTTFATTPTWEANWLLNWLVSYYKADTNWSFPDAHWSNDWTINGATFTASGKINGWYSFDGVNDYIDLNYNLSSSNSTIWFWYHHNVTWDDTYLISQWSLNLWSWRWWIQILSDNTLRLFQNPWSVIEIFSSALTVWNWYYIEIKRTATDLWELLVNWVSQWTDTWWLSLPNENILLMRVSGFYRIWIIDELWIWEKATSNTEDLTLYNWWAWLSYDNFTT